MEDEHVILLDSDIRTRWTALPQQQRYVAVSCGGGGGGGGGDGGGGPCGLGLHYCRNRPGLPYLLFSMGMVASLQVRKDLPPL